MLKKILSVSFSLFLMWQLCSFAWNSTGHMVVAAIAYRHLSNESKQQVDKILRAPPKYDSWKQEYTEDVEGLSFGMFIFLRASTWPDEIRRSGNPYDHPKWHYIDYPLTSPQFTFKGSPDPKNDILFGIQESENLQ